MSKEIERQKIKREGNSTVIITTYKIRTESLAIVGEKKIKIRRKKEKERLRIPLSAHEKIASEFRDKGPKSISHWKRKANKVQLRELADETETEVRDKLDCCPFCEADVSELNTKYSKLAPYKSSTDRKLGNIKVRCSNCGSELEADDRDLRFGSKPAPWEYTSGDWKKYKKGSEATLEEWKKAAHSLSNQEDTLEDLPSTLEASSERNPYWRNITAFLLVFPIIVGILYNIGGDFASSIISPVNIFLLILFFVVLVLPLLTAYTISKDTAQRSQHSGVDSNSTILILLYIVFTAGIYPIYYVLKY
jgi:hypothetical protein